MYVGKKRENENIHFSFQMRSGYGCYGCMYVNLLRETITRERNRNENSISSA